MGFALFFLAEYSSMILISTFTVVLFFGGWLYPTSFFVFNFLPGYVWTGIKVATMAFLFVWVRSVLPRYRYDQLMYLGWKSFLPVSLGFLILVIGFIFTVDSFIAVTEL
jgi:NADH-quinone oxidoreductase subunit H